MWLGSLVELVLIQMETVARSMTFGRGTAIIGLGSRVIACEIHWESMAQKELPLPQILQAEEMEV